MSITVEIRISPKLHALVHRQVKASVIDRGKTFVLIICDLPELIKIREIAKAHRKPVSVIDSKLRTLGVNP